MWNGILKNILLILNTFLLTTVFSEKMKIKLPEIKISNELDQFIEERKSVRNFKETPLSLEQISKLLWAANGKKVDGVSGPSRILPSAGAIYPLEVFLIVGKSGVKELEEGVYLYDYENNQLIKILNKDIRKEMSKACLNQNFITQAPITILITADFNRTMSWYGRRGQRYVLMEVGHSCQNIYLMATSLSLETVEVGAFKDSELKKLLNLPRNLEPLSLMPIGSSSE